LTFTGSRSIECPRYRREVERDIRVDFLNQFSCLYTEKRLSYEELFDLYYEIRVRRLPQYRWLEHVQDYLRKKRIQHSIAKI